MFVVVPFFLDLFGAPGTTTRFLRFYKSLAEAVDCLIFPNASNVRTIIYYGCISPKSNDDGRDSLVVLRVSLLACVGAVIPRSHSFLGRGRAIVVVCLWRGSIFFDARHTRLTVPKGTVYASVVDWFANRRSLFEGHAHGSSPNRNCSDKYLKEKVCPYTIVESKRCEYTLVLSGKFCSFGAFCHARRGILFAIQYLGAVGRAHDSWNRCRDASSVFRIVKRISIVY